MTSNNEKIICFLRKAKEAARDKNRRIFKSRTENMNTLAKLGMTIDDVWDEIQELNMTNYLRGPELDDKGRDSDDVWFFQKRVLGQDVYIKMSYKEGKQLVVVISFHC